VDVVNTPDVNVVNTANVITFLNQQDGFGLVVFRLIR
jgi:hypothetical protein